MAFMALVVGVFVLASGHLPPPPSVVAQPSGHLRWVRGTVTDASSGSLTVQLRDKTLTLTTDRETRLVRPAANGSATQPGVGSLIEVHYVDRKPSPRAVLILDGIPVAAPVSKRPGRSYRGVISRVKRSSVSIKVDARTRGVKMDSHTRLTGVDGGSLAVGWKAVAGQLSAGEDVLVVYDEQSDDINTGDLIIPGSYQRAVEIRKLGPVQG